MRKKDQENTSPSSVKVFDSTDTKSLSHAVYLTAVWSTDHPESGTGLTHIGSTTRLNGNDGL